MKTEFYPCHLNLHRCILNQVNNTKGKLFPKYTGLKINQSLFYIDNSLKNKPCPLFG